MKEVSYNTLSREELEQHLSAETFRRITLSFYRYVRIEETEQFRTWLFSAFMNLEILGRTYVAPEGINSQISVPEHQFENFKALLDSHEYLNGTPLKIAVEDDGKSFFKLIVRLRSKIVADGLDDHSYDVTNVGKHLTAREFNEAMEDPSTIVVDMRNHYESEVGHFKNALVPDTDTFRETLPVSVEMLQEHKNKKILLYCTGGIRCEKASAYYRHMGFTDVNQLLGGIIDYHRQVKAEGLETKFVGKNFVFDNRLGERITNDIIAHCHQCGAPCDQHTNCVNDDCHLLFIQCDECKTQYQGNCSETCLEYVGLPEETKQRLRAQLPGQHEGYIYRKSRVRLAVGGRR